MSEEGKFPIMPVVHTIIGLCIMFSGHFLPCPSLVVEASEKLQALNLPEAPGGGLTLSVTRMGMIVSMIFFGVIYLWTFVNTLWPGLVGILALIFSNYAPAPKVMSTFLGNPMVVMLFFLFMVAAAIVYCGLAGWLAHYLMTRDFVKGRPWLLTTTILITTYLVAFLDQVSAMFLMWPILYAIFEQVGFKRGDKYVRVMTVYIIIVILLSFASDPFKGGAMYLTTNLQSLAANSPEMQAPALNIAVYLCFGLILSAVCLAILLALLRFVFKADVSPLMNLDPAALRKEPLPPLNAMQKLVLIDFLLYVAWLLIPAIIGTGNPIGAFMQKNSMAGSLIAATLLTVVFVKGKPVVDFHATMSKYPWGVLFLIAVAMLLGGIMTGPGTNVAPFMEHSLRKMLAGMNPTVFTIVVIIIGIVFTNFCNSVVLGFVLTPVLLGVANAFGFNSAPMMACFIYAVLVAACTPAASPFAAMLYGQGEWIDRRDMATYSVIASAVVVVVDIVLGIPLARMLFG